MNIRPKSCNWPNSFFAKICDLPEEKSFTLPKSREEVINYLKLWNRTPLNSNCTVNIISYEQLIYYEIEYKDDEEVQLLINILKEKINNFYKLKAKWLDLLIDNQLYENNIIDPTKMGINGKLYTNWVVFDSEDKIR